MVPWFQGHRATFYRPVPLGWSSQAWLSVTPPCVPHTHTRTNHGQSLRMIGRISQSREREREKERRKERSGQTKIQHETNLRRVKCHAGYSQAKAHTIMYSLMEAQLTWYCHIAFPLFFIFHWIKHALFPLASGLQVFIQLNGFSHKFVGNWGLHQSSHHYNTM